MRLALWRFMLTLRYNVFQHAGTSILWVGCRNGRLAEGLGGAVWSWGGQAEVMFAHGKRQLAHEDGLAL